MKKNRLVPPAGLLIPWSLVFLVLLLFGLLVDRGPRAIAQITKASSTEMRQVVPGDQGTLAGDTLELLPVNFGGELLAEVGMGRYPSVWPTTDPWVFEFVVRDTLSTSDSALVRIKARRSPRADSVLINYLDTLVAGVSQRYPREGDEGSSGLPYGIIAATAGAFTNLAIGDTSIIHLRSYANYVTRENKRQFWFYTTLTSTVSDTSESVGFAGRTGMSLTLLPDRDSCTVSVVLQVHAGGSWQATTLTIDASEALDSSAWNVFTPDMILTGDSARVILNPGSPFKSGYMAIRGSMSVY